MPAADEVSSWAVEPLTQGDAAWEPPHSLRRFRDFRGDGFEWVITFLLYPLLGALPISLLACGIFYDSELPMQFLLGVCSYFLALALSVAVGSIAVIAVVLITTASRRIRGIFRLLIRSSARVPASARRKAEPSPGQPTVWDHWLDGV